LGPNVNAFEKGLSNQLHGIDVAALNTGTAALHLALILMNVQKGDEVICQSFTFSASANPIVYQGATPVFIDSEMDTWNMDPAFLRTAIQDRLSLGKKVKAIIAVDLYGMPAKMDEISKLGLEYGIPVIEDAAEALGSKIGDRSCGTFGSLGVISFNGNKIITTSGGGALVSNDNGLVADARFLATQARDIAPHYEHSKIGYNYRMSNVIAGIGRGQLMVLDERVAARRKNFERYLDYFTLWNNKGFQIEFQQEPIGYLSNRWLSCILVDPANNNGLNAEKIRMALENENIESRPLWKPMHMQPVFTEMPYYGSCVSDRLFEIGLCLPSGSSMKEVEFELIFKTLDTLFQMHV
jgi:dTDP-4-amino-4,6-dideoxygalactose transaminase